MKKSEQENSLDPELQRICEACHHDPFAVLGRHTKDGSTLIRAFLPHAEEVSICEGNLPMQRIAGSDFFEWLGPAEMVPARYRLIWRDDQHRDHIRHDPYAFPPQLSEFDLHLFAEGKHHQAYHFLGARVHEVEGTAGVLFAVWAPNAERVSVVGDFNQWDGRYHPMRGITN
jgi:1,4-alpha-glucan branching enzyme